MISVQCCLVPNYMFTQTIQTSSALVTHHSNRGSAHKNLTREKIIPTKFQKLVQPLLLKILLLCFTNSSNFLLMEVKNWNNPMLAGANSLCFANFGNKIMFPKLADAWDVLEPLLVPLSNYFVPNSGMLWIRLGQSGFFLRSAPAK